MMSGNNFQHCLMQESVAGKQTCAGDWQGLTSSGCDLAAGLLNEEAAGGVIPGGELVLEESTEGTKPHIGQVERRRSHAADAVDVAVQQIAYRRQGCLQHRAAVVIVTESDQDLVELLILGDADAPAVVKRALPA